MDYMLGDNINLNKFQKTNLVFLETTFSDNGNNKKINNSKLSRYLDIWK